jgi:hypothetical protein
MKRGENEKAKRIDLGLAIISMITPPGRIWSYAEMAAFCGCSKTAIQQIERKALRKLGNLFRFQDRSAREFADEFFDRLALRQPANRPGQERTAIKC